VASLLIRVPISAIPIRWSISIASPMRWSDRLKVRDKTGTTNMADDASGRRARRIIGTGVIGSHRTEDSLLARAVAARSVIAGAGLGIEEVDAHCWQVAGFLFWPSSGRFRSPDGVDGHGAAALVRAVREASRSN
jgi:hypothetical protein